MSGFIDRIPRVSVTGISGIRPGIKRHWGTSMWGARLLRCTCALALVAATLTTAIAAAATTNTVTLNLNCQSSTPIGNLSTTQTIEFEATAPDHVQLGSAFALILVFPAGSVSSSQNGGQAHVDYIKDLSYRIPVPANARYVSNSLSGGFNYGPSASATLTGTQTTGTVVYSIPGPIPTDQQFQLPALTINLTATGVAGSSITSVLGGSSVSDPGFTTTAHATSPFNGDAATSCFEPAPKSIWTTTVIVQVDTSAPTITLNTPAEGADYPVGAHVLANYACDDSQFGTGVATCAGDVANGGVLDTSTLGDFAFTVNASDNAGNATSVTHTYHVVTAGNDTTPPQPSITTPPRGAVYQQGATIAADYACIDNESGVATCHGDVADGNAIDTSTVGPHTFTVDATDLQGNPFSVENGYRVVSAPTQQNVTSGDVTNQIPVTCDNQFQTAHKTIPVTSNTAPSEAGEGTPYTWSVALGADFIPSLGNGTNLAYKFAKPTNGHFVSATLTGPGSMVNGSSIAINGDGTLQLAIASVTDQGTAGIGNDNFTPPPFSATIAVDSGPGTAVTTRLTSFDVTVTTVTIFGTTSHCTGGDPSFNGRANPTLTSTNVVDRDPPTISITTPVNGQVYPVGAALSFVYSCGDDHATANCTGTVANGASRAPTISGVHELLVTSSDAAGNTSKRWVTYTIDDPSVSVADANVVEGPSATLDFAVTLSNPSTRIISINYATADATALAPTDYAATAGVLTLDPGDPLTKVVSVPVVDDGTWRGTRRLTFSLVTALHASIGAGSATGSIVDDDPPPAAVADATVTEGAGARLDFAVSLAGNPHSTVTLGYQTSDDTAVAPTRYTAASGSLTFLPGGPLVQHVFVSIVNDAVYNESTTTNTQTMFLTATNANTGDTAVGTGTIRDDEIAPPVINIGSATIREGDAKTRTANVTVTLTKAWTKTITVGFRTVTGGANVLDFATKSGTLTFNPGVVYKVIGVSIRGDTSGESDEPFTVHLSGQVNALMGNADGSVTITDDDHPTVSSAQLSVSDGALYEGGSKPTALQFTISLNRPVTTAATVQFALIAGTARTGSDFTVKSGSLSFGTLATYKVVNVKISTDFVNEANESFTLVLSNATGGATIGKGTGTATILNDD
jgi:hypothetical protein